MRNVRRSVSLSAPLRLVIALPVAAALALLFLPVRSPAVAAQTVPTLEVQAELDPAFGIHFHLTFRDLETGTDPAYLSVELRQDGVLVPLGEFGDLYLECELDDDPSNDVTISHRCSFTGPGLHEAATYEVTTYVQNVGQSGALFDAVTTTQELPNWWQDYTFIELEQDIFTGSTDLTVRFNDVPASVTDIDLKAMIPDDFYQGLPGPTIPCTADAGATSWTCETTSSIPRLCIIDDIGGQYTCDGLREYYFLQANGVTMERSDFNAVLYRMSRYEEGQYFANLDFEFGKRLDEFLNLDSFVLEDPDPCFYQNDLHCYDAGYYLEWTGDYKASLPQLIGDDGAFAIAVSGSTVDVDATIPLLPQGTNGYRAEIAYEPVDAAGSWVELDLACPTDTCTQLSIPGLAVGAYNFELRVFNDHPFTEYPFSGYPSFGQTLEATVAYPTTVVIAGAATCNGAPITVDLGAGDVPTVGDDVILGTPGPDNITALAGDDTICGMGGDDIIQGGSGADWIDGGVGADTLIGAAGDDRIYGRSGTDVMAGNAGDDQMYGGSDDDQLFGGSGMDSLFGGNGNDLIGGSSGDDTITGSSGDDEINGGSDGDSITGGVGNDYINAGRGDDTTVSGGDGDDIVSGNGGNDVVNGDDGNDEVRGGPGNDVVYGGPGDDFVAGNRGTDTCDGGTETVADTAAPNCETVINVP
jgi:hypothetical protein